jgi:hypothetical protein
MDSREIISNYFNELSTVFRDYFGEPTAENLPFQRDAHEWLNFFYKSPIFRHTHLEFYKTDKICVIHSNIFPNPLVDLPILGFDMIAIGGKITGLFFDYSPTITTSHSLKHCLEELHSRFNSIKRPLPDWASFFSENFYCVTPKEEEIFDILDCVKLCIKHYLEFGRIKRAEHDLNIIVQNVYCKGQQKNDKTFKALSAEVGKENTETFMKKYLFPEIENY